MTVNCYSSGGLYGVEELKIKSLVWNFELKHDKISWKVLSLKNIGADPNLNHKPNPDPQWTSDPSYGLRVQSEYVIPSDFYGLLSLTTQEIAIV
jgi:hypothetical protein